MDHRLTMQEASGNVLVGIWRLVSFDVEEQAKAKRKPAFGITPQGRLVIASNGIMMALLTAEDRPAPQNREDRAKAFDTMIAYSGRYRIDGEQLITDVDLSWNEAWTGTAQVRFYRFIGAHLQLISAWAPSPVDPNRITRGILEWEREA